MTTRAIEQLFDSYEQCRLAEVSFWSLAERLLQEGLVAVDDVAVVYGIHPSTARKRLAQLHYRAEPDPPAC